MDKTTYSGEGYLVLLFTVFTRLFNVSKFLLLKRKHFYVLLFLSMSTLGFSQSYLTLDLIATKDTYIKKKKEKENFGSCTELIVDREGGDLQRALFQFDLSAIPSNTIIHSAELRLNCTDEKNMSVSVFQIGAGDAWDEGSLCGNDGESNWDKRTSSSNWSAPGVVGADSSDGTPISTIDGDVLGIHSWTITSLVQAWLNGTAVNNGVMVGSQDGGGDRKVTYDSRESSGIKPTLRIYFKQYFDNDSDGVFNHIDIDDDNDGILDTDECESIVNPPLSNADFEDLDILTLDGGATDVVGTSGIWKGDASHIPNWLSADPTNNYLEIWHNTQGAGNDAGGQAYSGTHWAEVNATTNDGLYQDVVTTPGDVLQWTFAHRKRTGYAGSANEDIVELLIGNSSGTLTSQGVFSSAANSSWTMHAGEYTVPAGQTTTRLTFTVLGTASGSTSSGNFIDNVQLFVIPTNCEDTDGDSIPDYYDLDSDNDGIPDIVEAGLGSISAGTGTIPSVSFTDTNNNGMHDPFETNIPLDSDGDGTPNYKDLDSDNDANFDVDEARTQRFVFGNLTFENGDGDSNSDGVGDGIESEAFREKDSNNDGILEYFGDGILDKYDYGTGANEYGNQNQGTGPLYVNNADAADTPDYIDLDSDNDGIYDIAGTLYANLDANNDGIIDDTNDSDGDGLVDSFDTNDSAFGSPRDLNQKLHLFFDGRNDYAEDTNVMDGWSEATMMAWIKIDPAASGIQFIIGQDDFKIELLADKKIRARGNGKVVNSNSPLTTNQWTHIAATYSVTNDKIILYINGLEVDNYDAGGVFSDSSSFTLGRTPDTDSFYFNGYIDEVRVFQEALEQEDLQKMVYQEIEDNGGTVKGLVLPTNVENVAWTNLKRYYRMDAYKDNVIDDLTTSGIDVGTGAKIYNNKLIDVQTAPLPFVTTQSGPLELAVNDPDRGINGNDALTSAASIVKIKHNDVYINTNQEHVGLIIDAQDAGSNPIEFSVKNDAELNVSAYLELDGKIDLEGESQLVQGDGSILDADSTGFIERDQQGTANSFNYNYWSSSVGPIGATGAKGTASSNSDFTLKNVLLDGSSSDDGVYPRAINFQASHLASDSGASSPVVLSTYWLWKYNGAWANLNENTTIKVGEGYTMKGTSGPVAISTDQNYVFRGKPNNGDFTLPITVGNDRLIGNPYPSALDADEFIKDNLSTADGGTNSSGNIFNGALYIWDHFGYENSHYQREYVGGYATRSLMGGAPAISNDVRINANGAVGTTIPERYIPVNQGFFVITELDVALTGITSVVGGDIVFKNSQRVFMPEAPSNSVFLRSADTGNDNKPNIIPDARPKIRLMFDSPKGYHRQILVGKDENASDDFDIGYDAPAADVGVEDMYWAIENTKFVIQGVADLDYDQELPIGLIISESGIARIKIDALENMDASTKIYIKDNATEETYDITEQPFETFLEAREYTDKFSLVFQPRLKSLDEVTLEEGIQVIMNNSVSELQINRIVDTEIQSVHLFTSIGQSSAIWESNLDKRKISLPIRSVSTGMYLVEIKTNGGTIQKKIIIN